MILAIAMMGIACAGPVNQISAEIAPCSLKTALEKLAPLLDHPWLADERMGEEIVFIKTDGMEQRTLQNHLAVATGGVWINREGKSVLTLPAWLEKEQEEEVLRERTRLILRAQSDRPEVKPLTRSQIESWTAQLELTVRNMKEAFPRDYESFEKARRQHSELLKQGPTARLLERIIARLDLRSIGSLEPSQQICLSDTPNRMERAIGFDLKPLLHQFSLEQKLLHSVLPSGREFDLSYGEDRRAWTFMASPEVSRVLLVITMRRGTNMPYLDLKLLDREGWVTGSSGVLLTVPPQQAPQDKETNSRKLQISPRTREWSKVLTWLIADQNNDFETKKPSRTMLEPWMPSLLKPETSEPLEYSAGDTLKSYSRALAKNVIASLPDRAITWRTPNSEEMSLHAFEAAYANTWNLKKVEDKETVTLRPKLYWDQRSERMNRPALGQFFRQVNSNGGVLVQHSAEYLWNSRSRLAFEFFNYDAYGRGLAEKIQGMYESKALTTWYQRAPLKFLGSLSEVQRRNLMSGGEISVSQLGSTASAELNRMFFSQDSIDDLFKPFVRNGKLRDYLGHASDLVWEKLPNGIPATTRIVCQKTVEPAIIRPEGDGAFMICYTPEWLGERLAEIREDNDSREDAPLQLGTANSYRIKFLLTTSIEASVTLSEIVPGKRRQVKDISDLPAETRARVEKSFVAARKLRDESKNKANQGSAIPPPRG